MASTGTDRIRLLACVASVALHATIVAGFAQQTLARDADEASARRGGTGVREPLMLLQFEPAPEPDRTLTQTQPDRVVPPVAEPEQINLGAADGGDLPSENWMGFAQPTPHSGPLGKVNQPQLDLQAGGGTEGDLRAEGPSIPAVPAGKSAAAAEPQQVTPQIEQPSPVPEAGAERSAEPQPRESMPEVPDSEAPGVRPELDARVNNRAEEPSPEREVPPAIKPEMVIDIALSPELQKLLSNPPVEYPPVQPSIAPSPPSPPSPLPSPSPSGGGGGSGPGLGEASDRQTDASSTERAEVVRPGHPVAAKGLEIVTRRPVFSKVTRVTAFPKNPTVEMTFGRDGRVIRVKLLESSGYSEVDQPVLDAVYAWTARGEALRKIPLRDPQAGITIKFTILLR